MIKALLLIFDTVGAWNRVVDARRGLGFISIFYLLPMLVLAGAVEGEGLFHWGKWQPRMGKIRQFDSHEVMVFEVTQLLLTLVVVFVCAKIIKSLGETFHGRHSYTQAVTAVAYGLSPLFLLQMADGLPMMSPWITWGLGILLSIWILYQGLPRVLSPDPTHALGLYLMSSVVLFLVTGLERLMTATYLQGSVLLSNSYLGIKLSQLLGIHFQ